MDDDLSLEEWMRQQIEFLVQWEMDCHFHNTLWGVPCGPTLSMVPKPPKPVIRRCPRCECWEPEHTVRCWYMQQRSIFDPWGNLKGVVSDG